MKELTVMFLGIIASGVLILLFALLKESLDSLIDSVKDYRKTQRKEVYYFEETTYTTIVGINGMIINHPSSIRRYLILSLEELEVLEDTENLIFSMDSEYTKRVFIKTKE